MVGYVKNNIWRSQVILVTQEPGIFICIFNNTDYVTLGINTANIFTPVRPRALSSCPPKSKAENRCTCIKLELYENTYGIQMSKICHLTLELNKNNNNRSKLILKSKLSLNKFYFILLDEVAHAQHPSSENISSP